MMKRLGTVAGVLVWGAALVFACSKDDDGGGGSGGAGGPGAGGDEAGGGSVVGTAGIGPIFQLDCGLFGDACDGGGDCCSGLCTDGACVSRVIECGVVGEACGGDTDCCNLNCVEGDCAAEACTADGEACAGDGDCCSGTCDDGLCVALNPACKTAGNPCTDLGTTSTECCSGLCGEDGTCVRGASFCVQNGDVCRADGECCTADCALGPNGVGTCAPIEVGAANCDTVEGMLCDDCNGCCSRVCAPNGVTGVKVCQPARGCRVMGDLCRTDQDCCGTEGTGLPGEGNVHCLKASPDDAIGICRSPNGCSPQGNVCHFKEYVCSVSSSRNNCCGATGESGQCEPNAAGDLVCGGTGFLCQPGAQEGDDCEPCLLDPFGVPRCNALGECREGGETCATSADCCEGMPCVPDDEGVLRCGETLCDPSGGACTVDADCCPGLPCVRPVGSTHGTCGEPEPPSGGGAGGGGGATATGGVTTTCALFGQQCNEPSDCCNSEGPGATITCGGGVCLPPPA